jgi:polygalacturonase
MSFNRCNSIALRIQMVLFASLVCFAVRAQAQDSRNVTEPTFPVTCAVFNASLQSNAAGPVIGQTRAEQNAESAKETWALMGKLANCAANHPGQAVELAFGQDISYNAFLLNPITVPPGISLIIDGGITVYGSLDPKNYQDPAFIGQIRCGTVGEFEAHRGCLPLFEFPADSSGKSNNGLYGYGMINGQGGAPLLSGKNAGKSWWDLTNMKEGNKTGLNQANPNTLIALGNNFTLYKITIRDGASEVVNIKANDVTVWGVKVQAPWSVPNTGALGLHTTNATIYDATISNGDQDLFLEEGPNANVTVNHFRMYSKDGIALLGVTGGGATGTSNVLIQDAFFTGDLPSVVGKTVNGMTEKQMKAMYGTVYTQALPVSTDDLHGLEMVPMEGSDTTPGGSSTKNVTIKSICIQDINKPIGIFLTASNPGADNAPTLAGIKYQDIHVLTPTAQFPSLKQGFAVTPAAYGTYRLYFQGEPVNNPSTIEFTMNNVVFDDPTGGDAGDSTISLIDAQGNQISTLNNVYPAVLNELTQNGTIENTQLEASYNSYAAMTQTNDPSLAYGCPSGPVPFLTGELYLSGTQLATSSATNLQSLSVNLGDPFTLNAIVEPAMSPTTRFQQNAFQSNPGLLAVGSPALTKNVWFYEGATPVGKAAILANGTLASLTLQGSTLGVHTYTAVYPADKYYPSLGFGSVTVNVLAKR